jgi:hypothetical protein
MMSNSELKDIMNTQLDRVEEILTAEGSKYSDDADCLSTFKLAGDLQNITPRVALSGMMTKDTVAIYLMVSHPTGSHTLAEWDEKLTNHIAYLVLLRAILEEEELERLAALHPMIRTTVEPSGFHQNITFGSDTPTELMTTTNLN